MESIKKLRELAEDINCCEIIDHIHTRPRFMVDGEWLDSWHKAFDKACEAIEAEIAEKYMRLPLDADGIPIHCGERIISETGRKGEVWLIGVFDLMTSDHMCHDHTKVHHMRERILEDVLQSAGVSVAAIEDVAAEIRELLGVEEE